MGFVEIIGRSAPLVLAGLVLAACGDDEVTPFGDDGGPTTVCEAKMRDAAVPRCLENSDCCEREECETSTGLCVALDDCDQDTDCPEGAICRDDDQDGFRDCVFERCSMDDECLELTCPVDEIPRCIAGRCVCGAPCQGGCLPSQGCCIPENECKTLPPECEGLVCALGEFVALTSTGAWDTGMCMVIGQECSCEELPPLPLGDTGLHSALAFDGITSILSAYNIEYGDLMFGVLQSDGLTINWEYVDGVPTGTTSINGSLDGPRGGNDGPGEDVGLYTDIAADLNGDPHIVYHDRDRGALKYALGVPAGWQIYTLEEDGTAGLYGTLTIDRNGAPRIAYLTAREDISGFPGQRKSTLRIAVSSSVAPANATEWTIRDVEMLNLEPFGCDEKCDVGEVCRALDDRCFVPLPPSACGGNCANNQRCIMGVCSDVTDIRPFRDIPIARGVWPSIQTLPTGGLLVAYHDRVERSLKIAEVAGPNPATGLITITEIDGPGSTGTTDAVGLYPSLYVTPAGEIHVAYMNASRRSVIYRNLDATLATIVVEEIEAGIDLTTTPDGNLLGAEPALVVDANGGVRVAYQDGTLGQLKYARRMGAANWNVAILRGDENPYAGSFGFYTDQALGSGRLNPMISTYRYFLSAPTGPMNGIELVTPP